MKVWQKLLPKKVAWSGLFLQKIFIIIIPLVLGCLIWFWSQKTERGIEKTIEGQYGEMEMRIAENVATIMENMVSNLTSQLEIVAKIPAVRDASLENCNLILEQLNNNFTPHIYDLVRTDKNGIFVCAALKELVGQDGTKFPQNTEMLKTQKPVISRRFKGITIDEQLISITIPVFTAGGKFTGSVGGVIKLKDIYENYLKQNVFAQRGYVILIDDNGDYLYHPNPTIAAHNVHDEYMIKILAESKALQDLVRDYLAGKTGITKYIYLKEWKLAAYTHAQITPDRFWAITITVPITEIQSSIKSAISRIQYTSFAMMISLIILSLGIIILLLRWNKTLDMRIQTKTKDLENEKIAARNVYEDLEIEKEKLAVEKAKDEALLESIGDGVVATDQEGKIIFMNHTAGQILGLSVEQTVGKLIGEAWRISDEKGNFILEAEHPIKAALRGKTTTTTTTTTGPSYFFTRKDGTVFPVAIIATPVVVNNKIIGTINIFHDITKEKEIEKLKTDFLSLASHQLRTPLSGIKWLIETMKKGLTGRIEKKEKEYLDELYQMNERMIRLVFDMLNVLRLESGSEAIKKEVVSITDLYQDLTASMVIPAKTKWVVLRNALKKGKKIEVETDIQLLKTIIECFVSNAINYTPSGKEVFLNAKEEKNTIILSVKDNGIGIPKEEQRKIFEKFYRASNAKAVKPGGTGLGLYIAKMLAEKIGGRIYFESKNGKGCTFYLSIPKKGV